MLGEDAEKTEREEKNEGRGGSRTNKERESMFRIVANSFELGPADCVIVRIVFPALWITSGDNRASIYEAFQHKGVTS